MAQRVLLYTWAEPGLELAAIGTRGQNFNL